MQFDIPERPPMPKAQWIIQNEYYCTNEAGARTLLEREIIRDAYEKQLKVMIEGCNEALK